MSMPSRTVAHVALVAGVLLTGLAGCGDDEAAAPSAPAPTVTTSAASAPSGAWLLRFTTAGGADGERVGAVYVTYDPATGAASAHRLPAAVASDAGSEDDLLLVSADHAWAIPDTGVPKAQAQTGRLVLYGLTDDATQTLDIRAATGRQGLVAKAWAFDPADAHLLRVVDSDRAVWKVDLTARTAVQEGTLPHREGWIFGNGFDKVTGEPYIESIDSDETEPAGNGDDDARPVVRQGGTTLRYDDGGDLQGLPKPPCDFAGGFRYDGGASWLFCADSPSITAYRVTEGGADWQQFGKPSSGIVPGSAVELSFALPPLG
jgi:hypothetical protein